MRLLCTLLSVAFAAFAQVPVTQSGAMPSGLIFYTDFRNTDPANGLTTQDVTSNNIVGTYGSVYGLQNVASTPFGMQTVGVTGYGTGLIRLPNGALSLTGNFTACVVFNTTVASGNALVSAYDPNSPYEGWGLGLGITGGTHKLELYSYTGGWKIATSNYDDGAWHVGCAEINSTTASFFKDGSADGTATGSGAPNAWNGITSLGGQCTNSGCTSAQYCYAGTKIAAVAVWSRALSTAEISVVSGILKFASNWVRPSVPTDPPWPPVLVTLPDNGLLRTPPMGWNSWYVYTTTFTEAIAKAAADALVSSGLKGSGYNLFVIDEVPKTRDVNGVLHFSLTNFPDDADGTYAYIKGTDGLLTGFYTSPGTITCGSNPGTERREWQDVKRLAALGIDYVKYDYCGSDWYPIWSSQYAGVYQYEGQLLGASLQRAAFIHPISYLINQSETSTSTTDSATWYAAAGANLLRQGPDKSGSFTAGLVPLLAWAAPRAAYVTTGHYLDLDISICAIGGSDTECVSDLSMMALIASPLILGASVAQMTSPTGNWMPSVKNTAMIAIDQDASLTWAQISTASCNDGTCQVWARKLTGTNKCAIALLNTSSSASNITATFSTIAGIIPSCGSGPYTTTSDVWGNWPSCPSNNCSSALGTLTTSYTVNVASHATNLRTVAP